MNFNDLWKRYFANVRWTELVLAFVAAVVGAMQAETATGAKLDRDTVLKAIGVGVSVVWAYLRVPKQESDPAPIADLDESSLPPGVDRTGPAHDIAADIVVGVIEKQLGPISAAAPELAGNIVGEFKRVFKRGIKW